MREALAARSERDFVRAAPRSRAASLQAPRRVGAWSRKLWAAALRRRGVLAGGLVVAGAAGAVALNAMVFQTQRHPAPLFAPAAVPLPPAKPAPVAAPVPVPVPPPKPTAVHRDPIGDVIRGGEGAGRPVAGAQRALAKLGYGPLKPDGVLGEGTRAALERFERDRRLPVTRDLSPKTLRALAEQAGGPLE